MTSTPTMRRVAAALVLLSAPAAAQWSPQSGQWGKQQPNDLRVMTWNVRDAVCRSNDKVEGQNNWCAVARIVAALQPDVLLLQECGDNSGNGTGSGVDSVSQLTNVASLLVNGGSDPYQGGQVTAYVRKYAPGYSLPYIFVSSETDGFNRNIILSRYPFADLNGDTRSTISDIPNVANTGYAPGGDGGIRGFQFAEIDLPSGTFPGDLVVGNAHLKAGGQNSDEAQRRQAAQNVAYYVDHLFNGAGLGVPDPFNRIGDSPAAQTVLGANTPVILGGDWNEDEVTNGQRGPAAWLTEAGNGGGSDGTDRDRSDMTWHPTVNVFTSSDNTLGGSKLDYVAAQDSLLEAGAAAVFDTGTTPSGAMPAELSGFPNPSSASGVASDHDPVFVDYRWQDGCEAPTSYCQSYPNSTGSPCTISYQGSVSLAANDFVLLSSGAPANTFGLFYYGGTQTSVPFGDGLRCVASGGIGIYRLNPATLTDVLGNGARVIDNTQPPAASGSGQFTAGGTLYFQYWYRDQAGGLTGFNLSDGLRVTFCP